MPRLPKRFYHPADDTAPAWSLARQADFAALVLQGRQLHPADEKLAAPYLPAPAGHTKGSHSKPTILGGWPTGPGRRTCLAGKRV